MSRTHLVLAGREQVIDLEYDALTGQTKLHFRPCENVIQTKDVDPEDLFEVLKSTYFESAKPKL